MLLYTIILCMFSLPSISCYIQPIYFRTTAPTLMLKYNNLLLRSDCYKNDENIVIKHRKKCTSILKLIRSKNILPTMLLSFSGAYIVNPSFSIIKSTSFLVAVLNTVFIMSASMIINDLFDMNIDKINNPTRPLITGDISVKEAILYSTGLIFISELLSIFFLSKHLQYIIHLAVLNIVFYTPILKKIMFLKNISCAFLISFASVFAGLSVNVLNVYDKKYQLLMIASRLVFFGSLHNELLLDVCDYDGDKQNGIQTVPITYGVENTVSFVRIFTDINVLWNTFHLMWVYNYKTGIPLIFICSSLTYYLRMIPKNNYSRTFIKNVINQTNIPLLFSLLYLCGLSKSL